MSEPPYRLEHCYVLGGEDGHTPIPEGDIDKVGMFFADIDKRRIAETEVGPCRVSTVFLCFDHNFSLRGRPVLFETMIFGAAGDDQYTRRYRTWDEAARGHARIVRALERRLANPDAESATPDD